LFEQIAALIDDIGQGAFSYILDPIFRDNSASIASYSSSYHDEFALEFVAKFHENSRYLGRESA
jgi:HD superfamily phosphohydrolase